jgi:hypothetical protein
MISSCTVAPVATPTTARLPVLRSAASSTDTHTVNPTTGALGRRLGVHGTARDAARDTHWFLLRDSNKTSNT